MTITETLQILKGYEIILKTIDGDVEVFRQNYCGGLIIDKS